MKAVLSRHRRVLAAVLAAAAAAFGIAAARPHAHGVRVLVAARDLAGGTPLRPADVAARTYPSGAVPDGAVTRAAGRILSGPVRRGEPLTDVRLRVDGDGDGDGDPATVAVPVRLADAGVAGLLRPGDRVDVLAARAEGARTVATAVPVLDVPQPGDETGEGALVVLRTGREQAAALARAEVDARLSVAIVD